MAINRNQLLDALLDYNSEVQYFVNVRTGEVFRVTLQEQQTLTQIQEALAKDPKSMVRLPKTSSEEKYQELSNFINSIDDKVFSEKLKIILQSPRPYRDLQTALERRYKEQRQWQAYKLQCAEKHLDRFLKTVSFKQ